jgi:adenosylcobinamide kinase/adenosylcobinamide-phosphate guanylyltransferase
MVSARRVLVLGGARSGKSAEAERLAQGAGGDVAVIVTALAGDDEMAARIRRHRQDRPAGWATIEAPLDPAGALARLPQGVIIIDCLTLWLANLMEAARDPAVEGARLAAALAASRARIVLVSNETGLGIVPMSALGRAFRDAQGRLNRQIGEACDAVVFMLAGHPLRLKPPAEPAGVILA